MSVFRRGETKGYPEEVCLVRPLLGCLDVVTVGPHPGIIRTVTPDSTLVMCEPAEQFRSSSWGMGRALAIERLNRLPNAQSVGQNLSKSVLTMLGALNIDQLLD